MKKTLLILVMIAAACQLKAQIVKPLDSSLLRSPEISKNFKLDDKAFQKQYFSLPPLQSNKSLAVLMPTGNTELFACRMPVAKVQSDDNMLIAKVRGNDRMPVLKLKVIDPLAKSPLLTP